MPVQLSRKQARLAARGCRSLAYHLRQNAETQENPGLKAGKLETAQELEKLAELFEAHATAASPRGRTPAPSTPPATPES